MSYTLGEAAKATGMSKAAISRAIKNGTVSAEKQDNGSFKIDPAELHRVYPPVAEKQVNDERRATLGNGHLNGEFLVLQAKLEAATQRLADIRDELADVRDDRDHWRAQAEKLLLAGPRSHTEQPAAQPPAKRRWWSRGGRG